jgi:hypothetical protein
MSDDEESDSDIDEEDTQKRENGEALNKRENDEDDFILGALRIALVMAVLEENAVVSD